MSQFKNSNRNFTRVLKKLDFPFPNVSKLPRAPDLFTHRDLVDVYVAKKRLQLAHLLPIIDPIALKLHSTCSVKEFGSYENINQQYLSSLLASGYSSVVEEIVSLKREEDALVLNCSVTGRTQSFTADKLLVNELVQGLILCAEKEKSPNIFQNVHLRKSLGEKMVLFGDSWLARKMFTKAFSYLEYYDDEELEKMRAELWILLSFVCIYHENTQEIGYDLPTSCLTLARELSRNKPWSMQKTVMNIFVPKSINVYGLRNDWIRIRSDYIDMYTVSTTLLQVLCTKKAKFWQQELRGLESNTLNKNIEQMLLLKENILDTLTCALAYADELRQFPSFIATSLRRGLYFEERDEWEKAMEDFNAMHVLAENFFDKESSSIALNRMGHATKILKKNAVETMDYFAKEWEICSNEDGFEELEADALYDLGKVLLEEGHTWEADECLSQANKIFVETRQDDTPNNYADITWALMGVAKGQHLWGRFTTLIRTQEKRNIRAIYKWKERRNEFPMARMPEKWYKPQKRAEFDEQYKTAVERHQSKSVEPGGADRPSTSFSKGRLTNQSRVLRFENVGDATRRLFEFSSTSLNRKQSAWLQEKGFENIFELINASDKPRVTPRYYESMDGLNLMNELVHSLNEMKMTDDGEDLEDTYTKRRKTEAIRRQTSMSKRLTRSIHSNRSTFSRGVNNWMLHDFRMRTWRKRDNMARYKRMMNANLGMTERLDALLEDLGDIGHQYELDEDGVTYKMFYPTRASSATGGEDDESEDSELVKKPEVAWRMSEIVQEEFDKFDENSFKF